MAWARRGLLWFAVVLVHAAGLSSVRADPADTPPTAATAGAVDSPRAALAAYLRACEERRFDLAAQQLEHPAADAARAAQRAFRLKAVIDRYVWLKLGDVSGESTGKLDDGLPADQEQLGVVPGPAEQRDPIRLQRIKTPVGERWVFSAASVALIDIWYSRLPNRWLSERLPYLLLKPGPHDLLYWQWLALPVLVAIAWACGLLIGLLLRWLTRPLLRRRLGRWDGALLQTLGPPSTLVWMVMVAVAMLPLLGLYETAQKFALRVLAVTLLCAFFWALARGIDAIASHAARSPWGAMHPSAGAMLELLARMAKLLVLAVAVISILSSLDYKVSSLLAGLGLGGLAFALAAQKTVENLFGAFSIGIDQPFRPGDFVKIEDFVGTVERIGLRSTRIRTLDRTLVSLPNSKLAEMRLESYTARDRIRFTSKLSLDFATTPAQMTQIVAELERVLREHPRVWQETIVVFFTGFGESALEVDVMAWFQTQDWNEFQALRQGVLLSFMQVVHGAGSAFAFPTRTLHMAAKSPTSIP